MQGCATFTVTTDYDPKAEFSELKTYAWMEPRTTPLGEEQLHNPLFEKRVVQAVDAVLQARGYRLGQAGTPDFYVGYHTAVRERIDVWSMNSLYGYPPGWGWSHYYRPGYAWSYSPRMITYEEGTLVLDIIDGESRQLIWRGSYQARLSDEDRTPEERQQRVRHAVEEILAKFPPHAEKD
jgi:hypothetical protein